MARVRAGSKTIWGLAVIVLAAFAVFGLSRCDDSDEGRLMGVPATLTMSGPLRVPGKATGNLEDALVALGKRYGLEAYGSFAPEGRQWQVQILCGEGLVAAASTANNGDFVLAQVLVYGFKDPRDFDRFSTEFRAVLERDVALGETQHGKVLTREYLARVSAYGRRNFMTQCSPPVNAAGAASAP